jgi:hypothetical protein
VPNSSIPTIRLGEYLIWPYDVTTLCERIDEIALWVQIAAALLEEEIEPSDHLSTVARLGSQIERQASMTMGRD